LDWIVDNHRKNLPDQVGTFADDNWIIS